MIMTTKLLPFGDKVYEVDTLDVAMKRINEHFLGIYGIVPSWVDDESQLPTTGETGVVYAARTTGDMWTWSGSAYIITALPDFAKVRTNPITGAPELLGPDGAISSLSIVPRTNDSAGITAAMAMASAQGGGVVQLLPVEYTINTDMVPISGVHVRGVPPTFEYTSDVPEAGLIVTGGTRLNLSAGVTGFAFNNVDNVVEDVNVVAGALTSFKLSGITFIGGLRAIDIGAYLKIGAINCEFVDLYGFNQTEDFAFNYENFQGITFGDHYAHTTLTSGGGIRIANSLSYTFLPGNSDITGWLFAYNKYRLNRGVVIESAGPSGGILNEMRVSGRLQCNRFGAALPDTIALTTTSGQVDISVPDASVFGIGAPIAFVTAPSGFLLGVVCFVIARNTVSNTIQIALNAYDTVGVAPGSSGTYNISYSGYPAIEIIASSGNSIKNSDFGQIDAEAFGNVCAVHISRTRNCVAFLAEMMTSATGTQMVTRDAEIGLTYAGHDNYTQDLGANHGNCNVINTAGGPYQYSGGGFTLSSAWSGRKVRYTGTADITIIVPNNLPKGFNFSITPTGVTGIVTFQAEAGGAVFSKGGLRTNGQYATVVLQNIATKVYSLTGDTQA